MSGRELYTKKHPEMEATMQGGLQAYLSVKAFTEVSFWHESYKNMERMLYHKIPFHLHYPKALMVNIGFGFAHRGF